MAENEIYRVEIPIIVDDQSEAPLSQARERVNRFEKDVQKQNERIRAHFQKIGKLQIEPVMKVRDQLTNSVLKADRLIKKLGTEQASPLIEAQDRVSAVVTRINAALKALDRGDVKVLADMQGPLMDEIVKAKSALALLNNVKAGPVADLRGELFGQLSKAMSQIKGLDGMMAQPEATLRERVTWKVREVSSSLRSLTSRAWTVTLQAKDRVTGAVKGILGGVKNILTSPLALLGVGGGIGGLTKVGIDLVIERENITMAFETLLGSADAAKKRVEELTAFAKQTPFSRDEIYESSRVLEVFTKGALSTSKGLRLVGDVAAGTTQPFEEVALWVGRLYDAMSAGRPVGEMTSRLQEMGAISGADRAKLEKLAESGKRISRTWPEAEKVFGRFGGQMEKMSHGLGNMILSTKSFFRENVIMRWGLGVEATLKPLLTKFRIWRNEHPEAVKRVGDTVERIAKRGTEKVVEFFERAFTRITRLLDDPKFENATFSEKVRMLVGAGLDDVISWLEGPGKEKLTGVFTTLGETSVKAYIAGMKALGERSLEELKEGNVVGAALPAAAMWLLGGGALVRGAWGIGKGLFGAGKWALGKLLPKATPAAAEAAATAGTAGTTVGIAGRVLSALAKLKPWLGRIGLPLAAGLEAINIARAEDKRAVVVSGTGRIAGMLAGGKAGATAGGALGGLFGGVGVAPGAVIGGLLGGLGGFFGGEAVAEKLNAWLDKVDFGVLKEKALSVWDGIKQKASETWTWIKENINLETLTEGAGYVLGYLEGTIFNGEWWLTKWENVKAWAAEKWNSMVEIWENTKETVSNTIFNSEWWLTKWEDTRTWAKYVWSTSAEIWESVKSTISSTLFNKKWWLAKWESVKNWASGTLENIGAKIEGIRAKWEGIKSAFEAGREAGRQDARESVTANAQGGILTRPHLGLVAEAGPEAIIPLSARMRNRALALYEETGRRLGVRPYAKGGFAGAIQSLPMAAGGWVQDVPIGAPSQAMSVAAAVNLNFDLAGLVGQVVIENGNDINGAVDKITDAIADNLRSVFHNMTK